MFGRLDALRRFLLKRMDNPDVLAKLHGMNHPERIPLNGTAISIRPHPVHRFRNVRLAALGGDRQGGKTRAPHGLRELLEFPPRRLDPRNRPGASRHALSLIHRFSRFAN